MTGLATEIAHSIGGAIGTQSASIYLLDPTGTVPVEPLADIVPGVTPFRCTMDVLESESGQDTYDVTDHSIQGVGDVSSHIYRRPRTISIQGVISGDVAMLEVLGRIPGMPNLPRKDVFRAQNFRTLARFRQLVMVRTPTDVISPGVITSINTSPSVDAGESIPISVTVREVRIVSPATGEALLPDYATMGAGSGTTTSGGQTGGSLVSYGANQAGPPPAPGAAPAVGNGGAAGGVG